MRDKAIVCLAGVAPDLDGLGITVDFVTRTLGMIETNFYQEYHRILGHGLPAAVLISAIAAYFAHNRRRVAILALVAVHIHFFCDLVGSRGTTAEDLWPIYYLQPASSFLTITWPYQWPLVGWQNFVISVVLMLAILGRATAAGYSPVGLLSSVADAELILVLRKWKRQLAKSVTE